MDEYPPFGSILPVDSYSSWQHPGYKTSRTSFVTMFDPPVIVYSLLLFIPIFIIARKWKKPILPHPPGPKGYPILGNVLDLPMNAPMWENFGSLAKDHGMPQRCLVSWRF